MLKIINFINRKNKNLLVLETWEVLMQKLIMIFEFELVIGLNAAKEDHLYLKN